MRRWAGRPRRLAGRPTSKRGTAGNGMRTRGETLIISFMYCLTALNPGGAGVRPSRGHFNKLSRRGGIPQRGRPLLMRKPRRPAAFFRALDDNPLNPALVSDQKTPSLTRMRNHMYMVASPSPGIPLLIPRNIPTSDSLPYLIILNSRFILFPQGKCTSYSPARPASSARRSWTP